MNNPAQHSILHQIALFLVRLTFSIYIFSAGFGKAFKTGKSISESAAEWMNYYNTQKPSFIPGFVATPYGYAIPWLEMILGLLLLVGLFFRVTTIATTLLLISIAIAVIANTSSLGGGGPTAIHSSLVMAAFCAVLYFTGPGKISVDAMLPKRRHR